MKKYVLIKSTREDINLDDVLFCAGDIRNARKEADKIIKVDSDLKNVLIYEMIFKDVIAPPFKLD